MRLFDSRLLAVLLVVALVGSAATSGAAEVKSDLERACDGYDMSEAMVPMRDGIKLHTEIYRPKQMTGSTGILLIRTPYQRAVPGERCSRRFLTFFDGLREDGYLLVIQSIRGRYKSEGTFDLLPPPGRVRGVDQTTDAWDAV